MSRLFVAVLAFGVLIAGATPAWAPLRSGRPVLHPAETSHWTAQVGLPDRIGFARQGLEVAYPPNPIAESHVQVAAILGLEGQPTAELQSLGFAVFDESAGIAPCVRIVYVDASGDPGEFMITTRMMTLSTDRAPDGFSHYSFDRAIPDGIITGVELGVDVELPPPVPDRSTNLVFDNVRINDQVWTQAADNG